MSFSALNGYENSMVSLDNLKLCLPWDGSSFDEWNRSFTMPMGAFCILLAGDDVEAGVVNTKSDHILGIQLNCLKLL